MSQDRIESVSMSDQHPFPPHFEAIKDRLLAAEMGLLNALIAIDGLFIGAASVVAAVRPAIPKGFFITIIACCSLSLILVLLNYTAIRRVFHTLLAAIYEASRQPAVPNPNDAKYVEQANRAAKAHDNNAYREYACYALLALTVLIFGWVLTIY